MTLIRRIESIRITLPNARSPLESVVEQKLVAALALWPTIAIGHDTIGVILGFIAGVNHKDVVKHSWNAFREWFDKHGTKFGDKRFYGHCTIKDGSIGERSVTLTTPTCKDVVFSLGIVTFQFPRRGNNIKQTELLSVLGCAFQTIDPDTWDKRIPVWRDANEKMHYAGSGPDDQRFTVPDGLEITVWWSESMRQNDPPRRQTNPKSITQTKH